MLSKKEILERVSFGERIAEQELPHLAEYFVETEQWRQLLEGEKDIVYGAKGSGKSALYALMVQKSEELFDRRTLIVPAETPTGQPVFSSVVNDPPGDEQQFKNVWKLYFLTLSAGVLQDWGVETDNAQKVYSALRGLELLQHEGNLSSLLGRVRKLVKRVAAAKSIETGFLFDPGSGVPIGLTGKVSLEEPSSAPGPPTIGIEDLLESADDALGELGLSVWILIDRLDIAFAGHDEVEKLALRALFRTYLDLQRFDNIALKIFLRTDIWRRITADGFREASHVSRHLTISWERQSLMNLVVRRVLTNDVLAGYYGLNPAEVTARIADQEALIERMFPRQVDLGRNPGTFDWMLSRTQDGSGETAPRELIHFLTALRENEMRRLELGHDPAPDEQLFERASFKSALAEVSGTRFTQTLCAEFPALKTYLERLEGEKTQHTPMTLAGLWGVDATEAQRIATKLVDVGFFEHRGKKQEPVYWVPFLYRDALKMVQGEAREFVAFGRQVVESTSDRLLAAIPSTQEPRIIGQGGGEGFEETHISFRDARERTTLVIWLLAVESTSQYAFRRRSPIVCAGLKQDLSTELDQDAFRMRLAATSFRWYTHKDGREGYRILLEVPDFATTSAELVTRRLAERVNASLRTARFVAG